MQHFVPGTVPDLCTASNQPRVGAWEQVVHAILLAPRPSNYMANQTQGHGMPWSTLVLATSSFLLPVKQGKKQLKT